MYREAELVHWMQNPGKTLLPAQVDIDLTNICNQDCYYCNSAEHRAQSPVQKNYQEYISLLDKIASWRSHSPDSYGTTHTVTFPGGGEPTILPSYEKVIEHAIDLGFLVSLTTNGSKLHKLTDRVESKKLRKICWIGVDIDAGSEQLYEKIRNSLTKQSLFSRVKDNVKRTSAAGCNVDLKILVNPHNDNQKAVDDIFDYAVETQARAVYFRPVIYNNQAHTITTNFEMYVKNAYNRTGIRYWINQSKTEPRRYKRCHQMYHFPVFCADGHIYTCCDNKGNSQFSLGRWDIGDFRDLWMNNRHHEIYNKTIVDLCKPCRPNATNNQIQDIIDNPQLLERLYT